MRNSITHCRIRVLAVMVIPVQLIRLFVASPGELSEERKRINDVVSEINLILGNMPVRLELLKWETHTRPSFGSEPQAVIDEQIGDEYDIFIGILWTKFGLPTSDASSGTEHEFRRAYSRYREDPRSVKIMLYFKDGDVSPSQIDAEQLLKVQQFKKEVGTLGAFYQTYRTPDEFVNLVRVHLAMEAQERGRTRASDKAARSSATPSKILDSIRELGSGLGFVELTEIFHESFTEMAKRTKTLTDSANGFANGIRELTTKLNDVPQGLDASSLTRHLSRSAGEMAKQLRLLATSIEAETPIIGKLYRRGTNAVARAAMIWGEFAGRESLRTLIGSMQSHRESVNKTRLTLQSFRDTISRGPKTTSALIAAQNQAITAYDGLIGEYHDIEQHALALERELEKIR
jgi:hypothetical protein